VKGGKGKMKKQIIVACGGGIATSTILASKVEKILEDNKIDASIIQCRVSEIDSHKDNADLIISSANLKKDYGVPVLQAISFISGVGVEETRKKIIEILKK